ncbi:putative anti-sigma regulatory factor, serine/threonine protein kinase [Cyanobacterium stanieri PCC 7202]|uniref:Anti-sigma regulatory factor, serine/threonine protein kinase n=1 Tax=Cyanobacterium stanieri (strain ATCC 29140 / PCC 7202) TaxID=292563 RepID=K9YMP4_CYASC|nr:putative anti-sigma regulatory factor, serine/threonine protein kinase [Cyanobacterium stanieri PCC 7202]
MIEKLTVPASLDSLKPIAEYVMKVAKMFGLEKKAMYKLRLAVDELATNIANYAYADNDNPQEKEIFLESDISEGALIITIKDNGVPFDPTNKIESEIEVTKEPIEERKIGGLGIFLAFDGVDDFSYQRVNEQNISVLTVYHSTD